MGYTWVVTTGPPSFLGSAEHNSWRRLGLAIGVLTAAAVGALGLARLAEHSSPADPPTTWRLRPELPLGRSPSAAPATALEWRVLKAERSMERARAALAGAREAGRDPRQIAELEHRLDALNDVPSLVDLPTTTGLEGPQTEEDRHARSRPVPLVASEQRRRSAGPGRGSRDL